MSESATILAATRQRQLLALLACPTCRGGVQLVDEIERLGAIIKADIHCSQHGAVGLVNAYRPSFLDRDRSDPGCLPSVVPELLPLRLETLAHAGHWSTVHEGLLGTGGDASIGGLVDGSGVRVELLTHPWSGRVEVCCAGQKQLVDLMSEETGTRSVVLIGGQDLQQSWSVRLVDGGESGVEQVILRSVSQYVRPERAAPLEFLPLNFGNPYPPRFEQLLAEMPATATVLDLGGGDRRHTDPRVFNLEYLPYQRVDLYADGLQLPFADSSFDLILSQAVLEHVPSPPRAVDEIHRVLKPGGRVYAEVAFMQPLHAVPFHFYNVTPHGAALLFEAFSSVEIRTFGGLGDTMRWFFRLMDAENRLGSESAGQVVDILDRLDGQLSTKELSMVASAVAVEATKP